MDRQIQRSVANIKRHGKERKSAGARDSEQLLIELDMPYMRVEHTVTESYFIALYLPVPHFDG